MKKITSILIICLLIFGCNPENKKQELKVDKEPESKIENHIIDSVTVSTKNNDKSLNNCTCKLEKYNRNYSTDLIFQNSEYSKNKNDELFKKWSQDSLAKTVLSIRFSGFDTIPKRYSIFKNIERLSIQSRNGVYGLDIFKKLKSIHFFGSVIDLDTDENWLSQLEILIGQKTKFTGLNSFAEASNLKVMYMGFSGFEEFPKDLNSSTCLSELTLGAYMFGKIDLSQLDLSKNECLKKVEFQTWYNSLTGIPSGVLDSKIESIKVHHQQLTELEKKGLKNIKNQLVKRYTE